jgi:hypothetical protein
MTHKIHAEEALPRARALEELLAAWGESVRDPWAPVLRAPPGAHFAPVAAACLAPDGRWLATTSQDGTAIVWSLPVPTPALSPGDSGAAGAVAGPGLAHKLLGHTDTVRAAAFNGGSDRLCTVSHDGTARIWALRVATAPGGGRGESRGDGAARAGLGGGASQSWREAAVLAGHGAEMTGCAFAPGSTGCLATVSTDGAVCIYAVASESADDPILPEATAGRAIGPAAAAAARPPADGRPSVVKRAPAVSAAVPAPAASWIRGGGGGFGGGGGWASATFALSRLSLDSGSDSDSGGGGSDSGRPASRLGGVSVGGRGWELATVRARVRYEAAGLREGFYRSWDDLPRRRQAELVAAAAADAVDAGEADAPGPDSDSRWVASLSDDGAGRRAASMLAMRSDSPVGSPGGGTASVPPTPERLRTAAIVHGRRSRGSARLQRAPPPTSPPAQPPRSGSGGSSAAGLGGFVGAGSSGAGGSSKEEGWRLLSRFIAHGRAAYACVFSADGQVRVDRFGDAACRSVYAVGRCCT